MQVTFNLLAAGEVERLKTALYRFAELKSFAPPQAAPGDHPLSSVVEFRSREAAAEFDRYWRTFRSERPAAGGFLDV